MASTNLDLHSDDAKPLLDKPADSSSSIKDAPQSRFQAHRRRVQALLQALWDSGTLCICNASICFSLAALFVKLLGSGVPVFQIVAIRSLASFTVCFIYARAAGVRPLFGHRPNLKYLLARGLFGAAAMTTYYFSLKMLPLADAVTLFFLNPAITAVAAWLIMKEPLGLLGLAGVLVSLCGLVLLTRPPFLFGPEAESGSGSGGATSAGLHGDGAVGVSADAATAEGAGGGWDGQRLLGTMFGLLSALLSTGAFISIRRIGKSEPALVVSVYFHVSAATSSFVPLVVGVPAHAVWPSAPQWALLMGITVCSFWGQIFIGRGFQLLNAAKASAINLTQVVYSYILGLLFLNESLTVLGAAGSLLIGAGAMMVNWKTKPKQQPAAAAPATGSQAAASDGTAGRAAVASTASSATSACGREDGEGVTGTASTAVTVVEDGFVASYPDAEPEAGRSKGVTPTPTPAEASEVELSELQRRGDGSEVADVGVEAVMGIRGHGDGDKRQVLGSSATWRDEQAMHSQKPWVDGGVLAQELPLLQSAVLTPGQGPKEEEDEGTRSGVGRRADESCLLRADARMYDEAAAGGVGASSG